MRGEVNFHIEQQIFYSGHAHILLRDRVSLFELFKICSAARPSILQLCALAEKFGLLYEETLKVK
jgi:hypothetical protein